MPITNRELISRTSCKDLNKSHSERTSNLINGWAHEQRRHFSKEKTHVINEHIKMINIFNIQKTQIQTTPRLTIPRLCVTLVRMSVIRRTNKQTKKQ